MIACTIIAKNYLAHARVLARSFAAHHPDGRLYVLVIDDFAGYIDAAAEPFEVLTPTEIGCGPFVHMALRYSVLELSTAVKPWLLRHLMGTTRAAVTYLDPDIRIYGSLAMLDAAAARHGVALIPHTSEPIPPDGRRPSQVDIMVAGVYNLGYVSVAPGAATERLLDWWAERLERDCRVDPQWGYFVDQRWFDLAPGFLNDFAIVREPEYNVAYWNLHSRHLELQDGRYLVDGRPLAFFHFSGFDPAHPLVLSRHQNRIDVAGDSVLERLLGEYAAAVMDAGHATSRRWPYSYARLGDGTAIDDTIRALYDDFEQQRNGTAPSPFTEAGAEAFEQWLGEQSPEAPAGITRLLAHVYRDRADLRSAFPDLAGNDRERLLSWAREYGRHEVPSLAWALELKSAGPSAVTTDATELPGPRPFPAPLPSHLEDTPAMQEQPWGVNVVGYFRSEVGTGEAARQVVSALEAKDVPVLPIHGKTVPLSRQGHAYATVSPEDAAFPINLICMNADMLPEFAGQVGQDFFAERYSIGLWFWEVTAFPEQWLSSFSLLEEVWAPTAHIATALEPVATVPVHAVRIPVSPPTPVSRSRAELGLAEDRFVFLYSFDYLSVFRRKNPVAVIEAFRRAFSEGEGASLYVKCINHERDPKAHAELRTAASGHPDVHIIEDYLSPADNHCLTALCDCYVSLHRAEGFGLVLAEAMWHGKPVIATAYSGNLDFMTPENSLLVDHTLVPIGTGAAPYPADGEWAEPDVAHAAALMRRVVDDRAAAAELGRRAALSIRATHSPQAAGEIMYRRLESIRGTGRLRPRVTPRQAQRRSLAELPLKVRQGPSTLAGGPGTARQLAHKAALRAVRPYAVYQQAVNADIVAALQDMSAEVAGARHAAGEELAALLGELRRLQELRDLPALLREHESRIAELERRLRDSGKTDQPKPSS